MDIGQNQRMYLTMIFSSMLTIVGVCGDYKSNHADDPRLESPFFNTYREHLRSLAKTLVSSRSSDLDLRKFLEKTYFYKKQPYATNNHITDQTAYSGEYDHSYQRSDNNVEGTRSIETKRGNDLLGRDMAVIDILVIIDYSIYQQYLLKSNHNHKKAIRSITKYYNQLVNLIDTRYKEMKGLDISMHIQAIDILIIDDKSKFQWSNDAFHQWKDINSGKLESVLEPHVALNDLQNWLVSQYTVLPSYDHAMAFTSHIMVKENKNRPSSGMAYISTICQTDLGWSSSIIAESGGFANVETASHELAHSLGARHDGSNENERCSVEHGYIMSPSVALRENYEHNFFTFSPCSVDSFNKMLRSDQAACLFDSKIVGISNNRLPGQYLSPDKQCKHVFGSSSGECKIYGTQEGDEICQMLWCKDPKDRYGCVTMSGLHAVYGTPCSKGMVCNQGKCVADEIITRSNKLYKMQVLQNEDNISHKKIQKLSVKQELDNDISKENSAIHQNPTVTENQFPNAELFHNTLTPDDNSNNKLDQIEEQQELGRTGNSIHFLAHKERHTKGKINFTDSIAGVTTPLKATTTTSSPVRKTVIHQLSSSSMAAAATQQKSGCTKDKNPSYCRNIVYTSGTQACAVKSIASYCCYSCSFYRR